MTFALQVPDIGRQLKADSDTLARIHTAAMNDVVTGLKEELRDQVEAAGLGARLANTWRGKTFPGSGVSLDPGGFVWTKAASIIDGFMRGATILPLDGRRYLAIPTKNVPLKGRGRRMTPLDVEVAFNQDLVILHGRQGRKLAFVNAIAARNAKGFRQATRGRLAQGRAVKLVLMFILTPSARLPKKLDPDAAAARWVGRFDDLAQQRFDAEFGP